jgi:hypothetical protein
MEGVVLYRLKYNNLEAPVNKVEVKVKFTLEKVTKAQRRSRGITLLFL